MQKLEVIVYCYIILVMPTNSSSPSFVVYQRSNCKMRSFHEQLFCTIMFYFIWPDFLFVGIVDISFQSDGTGKYTTPTGHLNFHFEPLAVSYKLFQWWNQQPIEFFLDWTQQYTSVPFGKIPIELLLENELLSGHYVAFGRVAGMCFPTRCTWLYLRAL